MTALKNIKVYGVRAKLQTGPGTPATPANTDGVLMAENADLAIGYAHDGTRAGPASTMGFTPRVAPGGRTGDVTIKCEPRGAAAAYSSSVSPNLLTFARACGLDAAVVTTGGTESYTFTPTPGPTGFGIASLDLFTRGQQYSLTDVYGDFTLSATGPTVPMAEFACKGLLSSITDLAVPPAALVTALQSVGAILPPPARTLGFTYNGITGLVLKSWSLKLGRTINARMNQNSAGHAGFSIGMRAPVFEFTVETPALATIDFYSLRDSSTQAAIALQVGATQYNRHKVTAPAAQVVDVKEGAEDPSATITVTCQLNPSAAGNNDEFAWKFD